MIYLLLRGFKLMTLFWKFVQLSSVRPIYLIMQSHMQKVNLSKFLLFIFIYLYYGFIIIKIKWKWSIIVQFIHWPFVQKISLSERLRIIFIWFRFLNQFEWLSIVKNENERLRERKWTIERSIAFLNVKFYNM